MDKNTNNWKEFTLGNTQEEQPRRVQDRRRVSKKRVLWFLLTVTLVVATAAVVLLWDQSSFDGLRRSVIYARAQKDESGCAVLYQYDTDTTGIFAVLEGRLISVSQSRLRMQNEKGETVLSEGVRFTDPAVTDNGKCAAVYDVGGKELYVLSDKGVLWHKETDGEILSVTLNAKNQVAVTANRSGYKAAVCVYDAGGEPLYEFDSSQRFCMTAAVSDDGRYLGAVTMGQAEGGFSSYLVLYRMDREEPVATCQLPGSMVYDLQWSNGLFCAVSDSALYFVKPDGELTAQYDFGGDYLRRCVMGSGYGAVLLSHYRSGSQCTLLLVDTQGQLLGSAEMEGEVLSLSAAGRYIGVLYSDRLVIYNKYAQQEAALSGISEARQVMMRPDGSAVLAGVNAARLYLP